MQQSLKKELEDKHQKEFAALQKKVDEQAAEID